MEKPSLPVRAESGLLMRLMGVQLTRAASRLDELFGEVLSRGVPARALPRHGNLRSSPLFCVRINW